MLQSLTWSKGHHHILKNLTLVWSYAKKLRLPSPKFTPISGAFWHKIWLAIFHSYWPTKNLFWCYILRFLVASLSLGKEFKQSHKISNKLHLLVLTLHGALKPYFMAFSVFAFWENQSMRVHNLDEDLYWPSPAVQSC